MNTLSELFGVERHYESQTDAIIRLIRERTPTGGATLSEIMSLTVNGMRIAGRTARITDARRRLKKIGETITCLEDPPIRKGGKRIRRTRYVIEDILTPTETQETYQ